MRAQTDKRGIGFIEVAIAIVVLALGLLPIFSMMMSGTRQSAFSEYHFFASMRAQKLVEEALTWSPENFASADANGTALQQLTRIDQAEVATFPGEYREKLVPGSYQESVTVNKLDEGLFMVDVTISWAFPTDKPGQAMHRFSLHRAVARPDTSYTQELPLTGTPPTA